MSGAKAFGGICIVMLCVAVWLVPRIGDDVQATQRTVEAHATAVERDHESAEAARSAIVSELKEIHRLLEVMCLRDADDDDSRRACLGR